MSRQALSDFLTNAELGDLQRPAGEALGLPGKCYGAEFFALEQARLFPRRWCPVGFAGDIPEPGAAKPVDLAGWPLLLVRGEDKYNHFDHEQPPVHEDDEGTIDRYQQAAAAYRNKVREMGNQTIERFA